MFGQIEFNEEEKIKLKKTILIIGGLVVFAIIISLYTSTFKNDVIKTIKINKSKDLIYTTKERVIDGKKSEVPYINMKGKNIAKLNQDLEEFVNKYYNNPTSIISYTYDVSDKILSLVVKVAYFDKVYYPDFRTYNINLSDLSVLSDEDLLTKFNLTEEDVSNKIEDKFTYFYNDALNKGYYSGECDYNCFLYFRGDKDYLDNIHYYIKNNKLYVYKAFNVYSIYDEEKYFTEDDFLIEVSD